MKLRLKWAVNDAVGVVDDAVMYRLMAGNSGKADITRMVEWFSIH